MDNSRERVNDRERLSLLSVRNLVMATVDGPVQEEYYQYERLPEKRERQGWWIFGREHVYPAGYYRRGNYSGERFNSMQDVLKDLTRYCTGSPRFRLVGERVETCPSLYLKYEDTGYTFYFETTEEIMEILREKGVLSTHMAVKERRG